MHVRDLEYFRDHVAIPRMMQLFENTEIPEGACYIDDLQVSYLDGRNCGHESLIEASGLSYKGGKVEKYHFSECDISLNDFLVSHKDCVFLSDGQLLVADELQEMELRTYIRNKQDCEKLFPLMKCEQDMKYEFTSIVYEKMKYLLNTQEKEVPAADKPSLDERINKAAGQPPDATHRSERIGTEVER